MDMKLYYSIMIPTVFCIGFLLLLPVGQLKMPLGYLVVLLGLFTLYYTQRKQKAVQTVPIKKNRMDN
ncbi:MAG: hypothetical protein ACK5NA_09890 [Enterococcus sp.]